MATIDNQIIATEHNQGKFTPEQLQEAFQSAKAKNMVAIEQLYKWFSPLVKAIAHGYSVYTTLGEDAENICWEQFYIFVKGYTGNDYKHLPGLIKKYLNFRMADASNSRRYSDPLVEYNDLALEDCQTFDASSTIDFKNKHLEAAFYKLSPLRQSIIYKYYFESYKGTEIANTLKISYKAYRHHHYSALNELRRYYLEHKVLGI